MLPGQKLYPPATGTPSAPSSIAPPAGSADGIKAYSSNVSGASYGNGLYKTTVSSAYYEYGQVTAPQWLLFALPSYSEFYGGAHWAERNYINGIFDSSKHSPRYTLGGGYYGDWVQVQLPTPITLTKCTFKARSGYFVGRSPKIFKIYGSDDGVNWWVIHDQSSPLSYSNDRATFYITGLPTVRYVALVVSQINGNDHILNFIQWGLFAKVICILQNVSAELCIL